MASCADAEAEGADVKALAEAQSREIEELEENYSTKKSQLDSLVKNALLNETDYRNLPEEYEEIIEVGMGGEAIKALLDEIDINELIAKLIEEAEGAKGQREKKLLKRLKVIEGMQAAGIKPSSLCLSVLPVIPPDLRPMVQLTGGRFATSDLNDLSRRVINSNNRLKKLIGLNAPEVIRRNEMRMLQEAVVALIDNNAANGSGYHRSGHRLDGAMAAHKPHSSAQDLMSAKKSPYERCQRQLPYHKAAK